MKDVNYFRMSINVDGTNYSIEAIKTIPTINE